MRNEPLFLWGLVIAVGMILLYVGVMLFMLVCILRDFIHRDKRD